MMRSFRLTGAALILLAFTFAARADSAPEWVKAVRATPAQDYEKGTPYVVLLDERTATVKENGGVETRSRYVIRVLTQEGRAAARREIQFGSETEVSSLRGWHVRADDRVIELGRDKVIEYAVNDDLYSDIRSRVMRFPEVDIGSVVAFEWARKDKPFINQDVHFFQSRAPVAVSRYRLLLPQGWQAQYSNFNCEPLRPIIEGNTYTWELRDLPAIKEEPFMPAFTALSPCLAVSYSSSKKPDAGASFKTWADVARWAGKWMQREVRTPQAIETKAKELTAGLHSDPEKTRALARWVQKHVRYVSVQLGVAGGYRPHPADVVLKKSYGDCKDKSALLQAMLRAVGIRSYVTLVFSGNPMRVRPEFPSPLQFNHAIVAVSLKGSRPGSDDLFFFDPTDDVTPPGDLPFYLQGSNALVVREDAGELVRLPARAGEANSARRELNVEVQATGRVLARAAEVHTGQLASEVLHRIAATSAQEFEKETGARLAREIPGAVFSDFRLQRSAQAEDRLAIEYRVEADNYANRLGKLLVIRAGSLLAQNYPVFTAGERAYPIVFDMASVRDDLVKITLPEGYEVDEVPTGSDLKTSFGEFRLVYEVQGRQVIVRRQLAITKQVIPPSEYAEVKRFFDAAQAASMANIVLEEMAVTQAK